MSSLHRNSQIYNRKISQGSEGWIAGDGEEGGKEEDTGMIAGDYSYDNKGTQIKLSSSFGEANDVSTFPEALSAEHDVVFADQAHLAGAASALTTVLSVFSRVSSPE